jgi:hypothetical protein
MSAVPLRHAHGAAFDAYLVFSDPPEGFESPLPGASLELYPHADGRVRAARLSGDIPAQVGLETLRALLERGEVRWLELGLRAYALMEGKREYRPWRKNVHLSLEALRDLHTLEPEVRYHAPV